VRRVNHATTVCADGGRHRECYAATVSGVPEKLWSARGGSVLVRGRLTDARIDGFPGLAALRAVAAWRPAGTGAPRGRTFRVRDNGVRCVAAPCFSLTATALEGGGTRTLSELDLARAGLSAGDLRRTERAVSGDGALVTGTVVTVPDAGPAGSGRSLRATQAWLRP
jgi:hypothetical protein